MFCRSQFPFPSLVAATALLTAALALPAPAQTPGPIGPGHPALGPRVGCAFKSDTSPALRDMPPLPYPEVRKDKSREVPNQPPPNKFLGKGMAGVDPVVQTWPGLGAMPTPDANFDGIPNYQGVLPPDTQGDVGPNHYVQWVNCAMGVYDKTGVAKWGPYNGNTIWSGFGGPADSSNDGDPIVLYDRLADRWFISQFALPNYPSGPFYQYIAVSKTPDPTGAWYRYAFLVSEYLLNDYPKFGVWPDGYYMSVNEFGTSSYAGVGVYVFEREKMLAGDPTATFQMFDVGQVDMGFYSMLPSHMEGPTAPAAGEPNTFAQIEDSAWGSYPTDRLLLWKFHVDWANPSGTTFGLGGQPDLMLDTAPFDSSMCGGRRFCIPQPDTTAKVDAISGKLMYRLQYRRFPTYKTLVTNHTVDVNGSDRAGVRWYELRDSGSGWTIYQQGTFSPDADHRWMGSAAMDKSGNIAVGYSVSGSSTYPGIRYAGRVPSDPLGTLGQAEQTLVAGGGSQTDSSSRWGDYSTMSVDPSDDCTFWYTQEYYASTSGWGWHTRVGAFRMAGCAGGGGSVTVTATPASGQAPLTVAFSAAATGGTPPYSYAWAFGDGSTGTGASASHTYTTAGSFTATATATDAASQEFTGSATVSATIPPPSISGAQALGSPFRLKVSGANFHSSVTLKVNGTAASTALFKSSNLIVGKGADLKALLPKGVTVQLTVTNNDDGATSAPFSYTR